MSAAVPPGNAPGHARAIAMLGGAQAVTLASGFARWKIIALFLGPVGVGIAGIIDQIALVAMQLGSLNLPSVALRFLAISQTSGQSSFGRLYRGFLRILLAGCVVAAAGVALIFIARPAVVGEELVPYRTAFFVALAIVPLTAAVNLLRNTLSTLRRHGDVARIMVVSAALTAIAALAGVRMGGLAGLYLASFVATLSVAIALHLTIVRAPELRDSATGPVWAALREQPAVLRYSATLYAVGFTIPLAYGVMRSTVLDSLGAEAAGFLAASLTIATGARMSFAQSSAQFLTPRASREAPKATRAREVGEYLHTLAVAMAIAALPVVLFPREVLTLLFSARFTAAVSYLGLFLLAELMMAFGDSYRVLLLGFDDLTGYFATTVAAPLAIVAGVVWIVPRYGIAAAALLQVAVAVFSLGVSLGRLRLRHGISPDGRALMHYGAMIVTVGVALAAGRFAPLPSAGAWIGKALLGLLLAAISVLLLPPAERASLVGMLRLRPHAGR